MPQRRLRYRQRVTATFDVDVAWRPETQRRLRYRQRVTASPHGGWGIRASSQHRLQQIAAP
ncbi:MAG: hypothetical protein OXE79_02290 [Acidimicrobiaceae bacterium]|nr:hypothetical protein [Acidimicrobiaceae bacterium]MCY4279232.1 hypothetical protein [Acidimicrobiaceae bacterium]MCY4293743.1 hypothetical protein [Acidimicrobiaceae bacterium]